MLTLPMEQDMLIVQANDVIVDADFTRCGFHCVWTKAEKINDPGYCREVFIARQRKD